jgi:hypothetical protein
MRQNALTVFDEFVPPSATTYTPTSLNPTLGGQDQLGLQAVIDNVTGTGGVDIFVEHSGDGRSWIQRNCMALGNTPNAAATVGDIEVNPTVTGGSYNLFWADDGVGVNAISSLNGSTGLVKFVPATSTYKDTTGTPFLAFVRLRIVTGTSTSCHIKIFATLRGSR